MKTNPFEGVIERGQLISAARGAGGPRPVQLMRFFDDRYPNAGRRFSIADDVDNPAHLFSRKGRGAVLIEVRVRQEEEGIPKGCALGQIFLGLLAETKLRTSLCTAVVRRMTSGQDV